MNTRSLGCSNQPTQNETQGTANVNHATDGHKQHQLIAVCKPTSKNTFAPRSSAIASTAMAGNSNSCCGCCWACCCCSCSCSADSLPSTLASSPSLHRIFSFLPRPCKLSFFGKCLEWRCGLLACLHHFFRIHAQNCVARYALWVGNAPFTIHLQEGCEVQAADSSHVNEAARAAGEGGELARAPVSEQGAAGVVRAKWFPCVGRVLHPG